jgi:hypothetical protein
MQYDSKDLDVINRVLRFHPDVDELIAVVTRVSEADKYPINSRHELMDVLPREKEPSGAEEDKAPTAAGVRESISLLPAYYFPIASADDLIAKLVEFRGVAATAGGGVLGPFEEVRPIGPGRRPTLPPQPPSPPLPLEPASARMERPTPAQ